MTVEPQSCICPSENYTCRADFVFGMEWRRGIFTDVDPISFVIRSTSGALKIVRGGLQVHFSFVRTAMNLANITSHLFIINEQDVNGSIFTCEAYDHDMHDYVNVTLCSIGKRFTVLYNIIH